MFSFKIGHTVIIFYPKIFSIALVYIKTTKQTHTYFNMPAHELIVQVLSAGYRQQGVNFLNKVDTLNGIFENGLFFITGPDPTRFYCVDCTKSFKNNSHYSRHRKFECGKEPSFGCLYCQYRSHRKDAVTRHMKTRHNQDL